MTPPPSGPTKRTPKLPTTRRSSHDNRLSGSHKKTKVLRRELNKQRAQQAKLSKLEGSINTSPLRVDATAAVTQSQASSPLRVDSPLAPSHVQPSSASLIALVAPTAQVSNNSSQPPRILILLYTIEAIAD